MSTKLRVNNIVFMNRYLGEFSTLKGLNGKTKLLLSDWMERFEKVLKIASESEIELLKQYGTEDEDSPHGYSVPSSTPKEELVKYNEAMSDVINEEIEIDIDKIPLTEWEKAEESTAIMLHVMKPIIDRDK